MHQIETLAEAQRRAERRLPKDIYNSLVAGTEKGLTATANIEVFDEIGFQPRVARPLPMQRDLSTTVLGMDLAFPVIVSPAGAQAIDPAGETAVARAAAEAGIPIGLSSFASHPFESVVRENSNALYQLYWVGTRDQITERVERARAAGAKALILTIDWAFASRRDWGSPDIPPRIDLPTLIRYSPMGISRPGWAMRWLRGGLPDLTVPNLASASGGAPTFGEAYVEWLQTPLPTWDDVRWLRDLWGGPFVVKGITDPDDARRAVDSGADAVSVSNHGGNNLDGTPASLRFLPGVVKAVGDEAEVLFDGGIRRGADVVKALALGARAALVGRVWMYGLAAGGEAGVRQVLEILRSGIDETLIGLGHPSVHGLTRDDLVLPDGFAI
jgi:heme/flavin dehydrogenase (mycofactocin system)